MRYVLLYLAALLTGLLAAQETATPFSSGNFEREVLDYDPIQRTGVSDKAYDFGRMVLRETVRQTNGDPKEFNVADYMNVLSTFTSLQEPAEALELAFERFLGAPGSCEYLRSLYDKVKKNDKYLPIRDRWEIEMARCEEEGEGFPEVLDPREYAATNKLDLALVLLMDQLHTDDQRYRKPVYRPKLQTPLDRANEQTIDSLLRVYGGYVGRRLVGKKLEHVMWSVVQHSRPAIMESYLPVVHDAVKKGDLHAAPLRMLVDRVQANKTGQQVFGSQAGIPLLPEAERQKIREQYGID